MPLPMNRYSVYADLSRRLTKQERLAIFEALETSVPGSGCVGPQQIKLHRRLLCQTASAAAAISAIVRFVKAD